MGGWMTYRRMRHRNNLEWRGAGFYPNPPLPNTREHLVTGDLNRMESDYLDPVYPQPPWATRLEGSDPSARVSEATGVDVETVRKVLRYVFLEGD